MNGLVVVLCLAVVALSLLIVYAKRRARDQEVAAAVERARAWPLDPALRTAREVRKTYDDLPYRGGRGWARK